MLSEEVVESERDMGRWSEPMSGRASHSLRGISWDGIRVTSGEERLPVERWRRVGVSGSFAGERWEEEIQSAMSLPMRSERRESQEGWCALRSPIMNVVGEEGRRWGEKLRERWSPGEERMGGE